MRRIIEFIKSSLQQGPRVPIEDAIRGVLRAYQDRSELPEVWIYVSTDLLPEGLPVEDWARDERRHFSQFVRQWAQDHGVRSTNATMELWPLATAKKVVHVIPVDPQEGRRRANRLHSFDLASERLQRLRLRRSDTGIAIEVDEAVVIGRSADVDVQVSDGKVSRKHLRVSRERGSGLLVEDLESANGSQLNGTPLIPGVQTPIREGDVLRVGDVAFTAEPY